MKLHFKIPGLWILWLVFFLNSSPSLAGESCQSGGDSTLNPLRITGYIEPYFAYDFGNPSNHTRPSFAYSYNRHNEVNLNLGFVKATYQTAKTRGNLALMTGTYSNANLAAEPGVLKNIFEANAGVRLSESQNLWVDAGVFPSHIGFESAVGKDCWNLTRSILADNSPYFETGVKISFTSKNEKWFLSGLILNGWQRIQRTDGNQTPAFGHQITWKPNDKITLNSSSFVGNDKPDSIRKMRYFHNLFAVIQLNPNLGLTLGFDLGMEQKSKGSKDYNPWFSPVVIARMQMLPKLALSVRGEYYSDKNQVIISTGSPDGFQVLGYSANLDFQIEPNVVWRLEGRGFTGRYAIFPSENSLGKSNYMAATALAISF